ncbi:MAG: PAS domain S-box protein [Vicinamibacterales bacterium]
MSASAPSPGTSHALLSAVADVTDEGIVGIDPLGQVHTWNKGAERIFGYTAEEMMGRTLAVLMPGGTGAFTPVLDRVRQGQEVDRVETVRIAKGNRLVHVSMAGTALRDGEGQVVGAVAVVRDISGQKRADLDREATDARWRAIIDSTVDAIVVIDVHGRIETFNRSAERMFGYTEAEMLGKSVNMLMPSPDREQHDGYISRYLSAGSPRIIGIGREVTCLRRDGTTLPVHLSVGEWQVGGERHFTGILHDLSPRMELEARLREQTALARLGEMAAVIAHEVKNPLAAVRGAIQVIGGRLPAGSKDGPIIKEIVARLDALNDLIKDLLLFARTPQPRMGPLSLRSLVQMTLDLLAKDPAFAPLQVELTGDAPPTRGDAELLKIVIQNLLLNAAQALHGEGSIRVGIVPGATVHQVQIADSGPGIPPEVQSKLFHPFFTTKARGTGLGLSIARRLVEAHHGTLEVTCPGTGGTLVVVSVPAAPVTDAQPA